MTVTRTVIICRHGEVDNPQEVFYGRTINIPLNSTGRQQIESIGKQIRELKIEVNSIHTSTLLRAIQTAEILAKHAHAPIRHNPHLVDVHIPALIRQSLRIRKELHEKGEDEYTGEWIQKGNESSRAITSRMLAAFEEIKTQNKGNVLIVGHGDPLAFLIYMLENPKSDLLSISTILKKGYGLTKGSGVILKLSEEGKIINKIPLNPSLD